MTSRLHQITRTAEKKDSELAELRKTIDKLRQSGAEAGLIKIKGPIESDRTGKKFFVSLNFIWHTYMHGK